MTASEPVVDNLPCLNRACQAPAPGPQASIAPASRLREMGVVFGLLLLNFLIFGQTLSHPFITFDDPTYVENNPQVNQGLNRETAEWAFTTFHAANWHPLTWLSLQWDAQLFGLNAGGYHLTNLLLHQLCTLLVFGWLRSLTGACWRAALVAALFAVHPMHVESVAWVAERKDVLSAGFFVLTLAAYTRWARRGGSGSYLAALTCYALGLLAKPMLVTLPAVLLLLDGWPLRRLGIEDGWSWPTFRRRWVEKWPFFALTLVSCVVTFVAQRAGGAVVPLHRWTLTQRVANALLGYADYLWLTFAPARLSIYYPERAEAPGWTLAVALAALGLISAGALAARRRAPYLMVGWCWFLGMLVPVIGLVQVGGQAMADRYVYLPHLGLFIALVWGVAALANTAGRPGRLAVGGLAVTALCACTMRAREQAWSWRDSFTLYHRGLEAVGPESRLFSLLGDAAFREGWFRQAERYYRQGLVLSPRDVRCTMQLGTVRLRQGHWQEAVELLGPTLPHTLNVPENFSNFGLALHRLGGHEETAARAFERSLQLLPGNDAAHLNLAEIRAGQGDWKAAVDHYERVLVLRPGNADVLLRVAWLRATCTDAGVRDGRRALACAERAAELVGGNVQSGLDCFAAAYAEMGLWAEAVAVADMSRQAAEEAGGVDSAIAQERRRRLQEFKEGRPLRF